MIKVLGLALYGPLAASTRYRLGQYGPGLAALGIDLEICHLLSDDYLRQRFAGGALPLKVIFGGVIHRVNDLIQVRKFDVAILYSELFPLMPAWLERKLIGIPYIYDFDDAFYLKYQTSKYRALQPLLSRKFQNLIRGASSITAGNRVLAGYAVTFNPKTSLLPTVVDTTRYVPCPVIYDEKWFTVGWIGSPSTAPYLNLLIHPLSVLGSEGPVRFIVIGGQAPSIPGVDVTEVVWQEDREVQQLGQFDVGVMPLPDDDWARGKCAFKLIQYMACGLPVIASPVGANIDVVNPNSGYLARTPEDWLNSLRRLRDDPDRRRKMGESGRLQVIENYSLTRNLPLLAQVIRQVASE